MLFGELEMIAFESEARILSNGDVAGDGLSEMGMWLMRAVGGMVSRFARSKVWQKAVVSCCDEASLEAVGGARSGTTARQQSEIK